MRSVEKSLYFGSRNYLFANHFNYLRPEDGPEVFQEDYNSVVSGLGDKGIDVCTTKICFFTPMVLTQWKKAPILYSQDCGLHFIDFWKKYNFKQKLIFMEHRCHFYMIFT